MALTFVPSVMIDRPLVTIASASTVNIGAAASDNISVTGTTTITAFDSIAAGAVRTVTFAGALTLTHNATTLILPSSANITTAAGDVATFISLGSGNWRCVNYMKVSGQAVVAPAAGVTSVATGNGLTGGTITSTGTISITAPSVGSVGDYIMAFYNGYPDYNTSLTGIYTCNPNNNANTTRAGTWRCLGMTGAVHPVSGFASHLWVRTA